MTARSLEGLLERLKQGSVSYGYGAILTFNRQQVNRLLQEQYINGLQGLGFLLPFTGRFFINTDQTEEIELRGIVLGPPILSFESVSLSKPALTLTLTIVSGNLTYFRHAVGAPPAVLSAFSISAEMGFHIQMQADLNQATGQVDKHGLVTLDLSVGAGVTCNLSALKRVNELIGGYFQRYFAGQPEQQRRFVLGRLTLSSYNPLSPVEFLIRTQRAPGAENPDADNYGDGAVVVFIRLKAQEGEPPGAPPYEGSDFPYLIPDEPGNYSEYSASLLIARQYVPLVDDEQLDVLKNMMFPGHNLFVEHENGRHEPCDLVLFGNVQSSPSAVLIEPLLVELGAAQRQAFVARRGDGTPVIGVQWSVSSPDYPAAVGEISAGGTYTASVRTQMRRNRLPIVVTARYQQDGREQVSSALVHERLESLSVAPLVQIKSGADLTPVAIQAGTVGSDTLQFKLLEPQLGARLEHVDANHQLYHPPAQVQAEAVIVQTVEVTAANETVRASIVLVNKPLYLVVEPYYVTGLADDESLQLQVQDIAPDILKWSVEGPGTVVNGLFTPDPDAEGLISVVVCELPAFQIYPAQYGIAIINRQSLQNPSIDTPLRWEELNEFSISAPGGLVKAYANGLQQIALQIKLQTRPINVDGQDVHIPVSDVELSRLRLVDLITGQDMPFVESFQEGIEYGSPIAWASHVRANRFNQYSATVTGKARHPRYPEPLANGVRYRELYIHTTVQGAREFSARFQADDGSWWSSDDDNIGGEGSITLQGVLPPVLDPVTGPNHDYELVRERAFDGEGNSGPDKNDDFSYFLDSVDYWHLGYKRLGAYPVSFATLEVEGNISTIQWESEALEETFFSYTGLAFYPARFRGSDLPPAGLSFDVYYRAMLVTQGAKPLSTQFHGGKKPSPGRLLVSLHREADKAYWHDGMAQGDNSRLYRKRLDPPVILVLLDEEGNRHRLQVGFQAPSIDDSRNLLILNVQ